MTRPPVIRAFLGDEVIADSFAGGGGASTGIELALGRSPDIAVNHDAEAIAMHAANHPTTRHYTESVWEVDPRVATGGRPVALAWFSPDCKHHSKAKGGKPRDQRIRGLAWVAVTWAQRVRPRVIALENVEEFRDWGPLHRRHLDDCICDVGDVGGCRKGCLFGKPIAARRGETFRAFILKLERLGYVVEHRLLRACDYGAPTTRRRLFLIARCDGQSIRWPAATHGPANTGRPNRHRTAAEIIDWSIPCPSIFDRERPLADKTMARIARGIRKFVLENPRPFVIKAKTHGGGGNDAMPADEPLRTVTASKRGEFAIVAPTFVRTSMHQSFGLYLRGELAGVALFGPPASTNAHRAVWPTLTSAEAVTCGRLVLLDAVPGNGESWFIARCFDLLRARGVAAVESCADPEPRTRADGSRVHRGHLGIVYQALNARHTGRTNPATLRLLPDGTCLSNRSAGKVVRGERGAGAVVAKLVRWGAEPLRAGEDPLAWLQLWRARLTRPMRHHGNFRYLWCLDRRRRREVLGRHAAVAYPKWEARAA